MISTGYSFRSILNQTGNFNQSWSISLNNRTGYCEFGLSGNNDKLFYKVQNGELYDFYNNPISSYEENVPYSFSNQIIDGTDTFIFNGETQYFRKSLLNSNYNYNYFYIYPSGCEVDFNFSIRGETTDFDLGSLNKKFKDLNTNFSIVDITGRLINKNQNLEVKIFSGEILQNNPRYYIEGIPLSFYRTGDFYLKSFDREDPFFENEVLPIRFYTNFGQVEKNILISGELLELNFDLFSITPESDEYIIGQSGTQNFYINYGKNDGANLQFKLSYIDGPTGYIYGPIQVSGGYNDIIFGFISGCGRLSKTVTQEISLTGYNEFESVQIVSGITGLVLSKDICATGFVEHFYSLKATGLGSGFITKDISASGYVDRKISGYVSYLDGGIIYFGEDYFKATGFDLNHLNQSLIITGYAISGLGQKRLYYTGEITGLPLLSGQYYDKIFEYRFEKENYFWKSPEYYLTGTGYATNDTIKTGKVDGNFFLNFNEGYYSFSKNVEDITGVYKLEDNTQIITGLSGLLTCKKADDRKYLGVGKISGKNNFSLYITPCEDLGIYFKYLATGSGYDVKHYILDGQDIPVELDAKIPKFITIIPASGLEASGSQRENINYLLQNQYGNEIRTRISHLGDTSSGSGFFSGVVNVRSTCDNNGAWEFALKNAIEKTGYYYSPYFSNMFSATLMVNEENEYVTYDNSIILYKKEK